MLLNKRIRVFFITICGTLGVFLILCCFIRQQAPLFDGIWANEGGSFILDTDNATVTIKTAGSFEVLDIAHAPGIYFVMFYPPPEDNKSVYAGDFIHTGEIYRIKFFCIDYIRVKCNDGCFDVWLKRT